MSLDPITELITDTLRAANGHMSEAAAVLGEAKDAVLAQRAHIQELEAALLAVRDAAFVGDIKRVRAITNDALRRGMLS